MQSLYWHSEIYAILISFYSNFCKETKLVPKISTVALNCSVSRFNPFEFFNIALDKEENTDVYILISIFFFSRGEKSSFFNFFGTSVLCMRVSQIILLILVVDGNILVYLSLKSC